MADTKLTALTETTSPATTDDVYIVTTPGGTPASKRCTIANLKATLGYPTFTGVRYSSNSAQNIVNNATVAIVNFEDQVYDSGGGSPLVTTGASWKFTAPVTGYYHVDCLIQFASSANWTYAERGFMQLFKNNSALISLDRVDHIGGGGASGMLLWLKGSATVNLTATEYIDVRVAQNSGADLALSNDPLTVWINIERVG